MQELTDTISKSRDTAVAPGDIRYQMLKHLPIEALNTFVSFKQYLCIWQISRQLANFYSNTGSKTR